MISRSTGMQSSLLCRGKTLTALNETGELGSTPNFPSPPMTPWRRNPAVRLIRLELTRACRQLSQMVVVVVRSHSSCCPARASMP